ncbi:MAG TPA: hypothetical protein VKB35_16105 [Ktedonobacteraceae bacterium]|nr:hypothetical protein [Ktedonobacteraceae bacterium]
MHPHLSIAECYVSRSAGILGNHTDLVMTVVTAAAIARSGNELHIDIQTECVPIYFHSNQVGLTKPSFDGGTAPQSKNLNGVEAVKFLQGVLALSIDMEVIKRSAAGIGAEDDACAGYFGYLF